MRQSQTDQISTDSPEPRLQSHLPSLDGMRAISIFLVLACHGAAVISRSNYFFGYVGKLGVSIFFVISGLLITWLMIRERDATGSFSLRNFYIRRFLRILPVFCLLILAVTLLKVANVISIQWLDILRALTFTHNYPFSLHHFEYAVWLNHTWSLSLEEQFYLVWPGLFALLRPRYAARLAAVLSFSGPVLRLLNYFCFPALRGTEWGTFHTRIDILMAGCASAFLLESPRWRQRISRVPVWPTLASTSFILLVAEPYLGSHLPPHTLADVIFSFGFPTLEAIAIALTLLVLVAGKPGASFRVLNAPVTMHIGKLSYSIYIWQQLALSDLSGIYSGSTTLVWRMLVTYLVSLCSYNFFERPFIKLRSRFRRGVAV